ncbi:hypothetical protein C2G38_2046994 [Gigaspora rosea]|uniref:Uncharacterized protein n=1 Tax=Gigaspora rosea TaxID=44941 RepID=A0A397UAW0_9GLOM|nr:hypothetical protein C2G38_2046994 [Gigaspora rosea]
MDFCTDCKCNRPYDQFVWNGKRHKTCKRCKENRDRNKNSLDRYELIQQDNFEILPKEDITHTTIMIEGPESTQHENHIEVNYLDLGDLIEQEIQEMTIGAPTNRVADMIFQTHLVVKLDSTMFYNKTAKEIAGLIVAEIEGGDDYSWE